MMIRIILDK